MYVSRAIRGVLWAAALFAYCGHVLADKMTWAPCDEGLTVFTPSSVTLSPDPPVIGSAATFVISGHIGSEVQGGSVDMVVSFAGFPIYSSSSDLCSKTTCPVPAGPISLTLEEALPPIAPPGDYGLQVIARGPSGEELACVSVNFSLVLPSTDSSLSTSAAALRAAAVGAGHRHNMKNNNNNPYSRIAADAGMTDGADGEKASQRVEEVEDGYEGYEGYSSYSQHNALAVVTFFRSRRLLRGSQVLGA